MKYRLFFLDFETASELDVKKVGSARYSRHDSTFIYCMACAYDKGHIHVYKNQGMIDSVVWEAARQNNILFVAHNAMFEIEIIRHVLGIDICPSRFIDTMAIAGHLTMMDALEGVGKIINEPKLEVGQRLINKLCHLPTKWNPQNAPNDFEELYRYCKQDVNVSRKYYFKYGHLFPTIEQKIWECTSKINLHGLPVNMRMINHMVKQVAGLKKINDDKCLKLCGLKTSQTVKLAKFCGMESVAKVPLRTAMREFQEGESNLSLTQHEVLRLRKLNSLSSLSKLNRVQILQAENHVYHGFKYAGASRTGRWSGRGLQPQNLPRGHKKEQLTETLQKIKESRGSLEDISNCIRAIVQAEPGHAIFVGDYSQIECRILAYLAGVKQLLEAFANKADPYKIMAAEIYRKTAAEVTDKERFMGKQVVLACGYGMGGGKFMELLFDSYDVDLELWQATDHVYQYRDLFFQVPLYWDAIFTAFVRAYNGIPCKVGRIEFEKLGSRCVTVKLISGRKLYYWDVKGDIDGLTYAQPAPNGKRLFRRHLYGGAIVGHICQGTSRDITAVATLRFFNAGWNPIGFVHDEILTHDSADRSVQEFEEILLKPIPWASGIPIGGECFKAQHYQKG